MPWKVERTLFLAGRIFVSLLCAMSACLQFIKASFHLACIIIALGSLEMSSILGLSSAE